MDCVGAYTHNAYDVRLCIFAKLFFKCSHLFPHFVVIFVVVVVVVAAA